MSPLVRRSEGVVVHLVAGGDRCDVHGWVDDVDELFLRLHLPCGEPLPTVGDLIDVTVVGVEVRATVQAVTDTVVTVLRPLGFRVMPSTLDEPGDGWDPARDRD